MEILLKIYDDADDWVSTARIASGRTLWTLIIILVASLTLSLSHWITGLIPSIAALTLAAFGLWPVARDGLRRLHRHE